MAKKMYTPFVGAATSRPRSTICQNGMHTGESVTAESL